MCDEYLVESEYASTSEYIGPASGAGDCVWGTSNAYLVESEYASTSEYIGPASGAGDCVWGTSNAYLVESEYASTSEYVGPASGAGDCVWGAEHWGVHGRGARLRRHLAPRPVVHQHAAAHQEDDWRRGRPPVVYPPPPPSPHSILPSLPIFLSAVWKTISQKKPAIGRKAIRF